MSDAQETEIGRWFARQWPSWRGMICALRRQSFVWASKSGRSGICLGAVLCVQGVAGRRI
jgi:hypothetical protein